MTMLGSRKRQVSKSNKYIPPGRLGRELGFGTRTHRLLGEQNNIGHASLLLGGITSHHLIIHFGELQHEEDFDQDCISFIDILRTCRKFIDIGSVGVKIVYGNGKQLRKDADVYAMFKEHEGLRDIHVYVEEDGEEKPIPFRIPRGEDPPKVTSVKIFGDLIEEKVVTISGVVTGGTEDASFVQWYKTSSAVVDTENDIEEIGIPRTTKNLQLSPELVGYYIVAKYTPMTEDGNSGEPTFATSEKKVESAIRTQKKKNVRGKNKNIKVAALRSGQKLPIIFYNNRAVGDNHQLWARYLGKIVRDPNVCRVQIKSWKEFEKPEKDHMWAVVKDKFQNSDIDLYREHTLEHMNTLWSNWRSMLYKTYVSPCNSMNEALKNKPQDMEKDDWEWLVTKYFFTEEFQQRSSRNSYNRGQSSMPHRTGSKPHRELIYEMGGKNGTPPDIGKLFFETRKKGEKLVEPETEKKYAEIVETMQAEPELSNLDVVEKCFGTQSHSHVVGFGGGIKRKHFNDTSKIKMDELQAKLREKEEENQVLKKLIERIEGRLDKIEHCIPQPSSTPTASTQSIHDINQDTG